MFRDRPDILTAGRYVIAPKATKVCPVPHNLGSRDWTSDEREPWPALGEYEGPRKYSKGAVEVLYPDAGIIGSPACLSDGEAYPPSDVERTFLGGFDSRCYLPVDVEPPPELAQELDIADRQTQLQIARIQEKLYDDAGEASALLVQLLGGDCVVFGVDDSASIIPGSLVGVKPDFSLVMVSGTSNFQQIALQILFGLPGMVDYGTFSTNPVWFSACLAIEERIADAGVDPLKPIVLVGHSYGGAVAELLAMRFRVGQPQRRIQLLTFGAPKPGDIGVKISIDSVRHIHLANRGDPVPGIPPSGPELLALGILIPPAQIELWMSVVKLPNQWIVASDGSTVESDATVLTLFDAFELVTIAVFGGVPGTYFPHRMAEYVRRLELPP